MPRCCVHSYAVLYLLLTNLAKQSLIAFAAKDFDLRSMLALFTTSRFKA